MWCLISRQINLLNNICTRRKVECFPFVSFRSLTEGFPGICKGKLMQILEDPTVRYAILAIPTGRLRQLFLPFSQEQDVAVEWITKAAVSSVIWIC
jgi:hypothetical protein